MKQLPGQTLIVFELFQKGSLDKLISEQIAHIPSQQLLSHLWFLEVAFCGVQQQLHHLNCGLGVTVTGFIVGAAVAHNFGLASSATGIGTGPVALAVACGFVVLAVISVANMAKLEG